MAKTRDELRAAILGVSGRKKKTALITLFDQEVEIRQPTLGQINAMAEDDTVAIAKVLIEYCYVPGTDEHIFDESDVEGILELPGGGWLTDLNSKIAELSGVDMPAAIQAAEKNSKGTA